MKKPSRPKTRAPEPLIVALGRLQMAEEAKALAQQFLAPSNNLRTRVDYDRAFAGLQSCIQLLGQVQPAYRQSLEGMRKGLVSQFKVFLLGQRQWMEEDVFRVWSETLPLLEKHLDKHIWLAIKSNINSIFDGNPPL